MVEGTVPETCIYSETYSQKELCLNEHSTNSNEFDVSVQKIKDYFGFDEDAWLNDTNSNDDWYSDSNHTIHCRIRSGDVLCEDSSVGACDYNGDYLGAFDYSENFVCIHMHGGASSGYCYSN